MRFTLQTHPMDHYLTATNVIDYTDPGITALSAELRRDYLTPPEYAKAAFEYVRDEISHSADIKGTVVTCRASDVLHYREGICFAKAHLLAAILRCGGVPAGVCYQKLVLSDDNPAVLTLHGLNAVYLSGQWIRLDARGNKPGVNAQFSLTEEHLAFPIRAEMGEKDFDVNYANPVPSVLRSLTSHDTLDSLWVNLPTEL